MGTVAKTKLKRMDRFELLELIYNMRKANLDLTERLEAAEREIEALKAEADQRVEAVRAEYVQRIDELRMQGSAKEMQKRLREIEEQMLAFQRAMGKEEDEPGETPEPTPDTRQTAEIPASDEPAVENAEEAAPPREDGAETGAPADNAGESGE